MEGRARVAVVGAGRMGAAMVGTLRRAGLPVVVFNRTRAKAEAAAQASGAEVAASAREAATGAQVVLSSLADDAAVEAAYRGSDGVAAGLGPGTVVCESSTIDPGTVQRLQPLIEDRGAFLLDTPVSGSVSTVEAGQLTFMVGGDPAVLDRVRPVLDPLAKQVFHIGELGSGAVMKLVVNSVLHGLNLALDLANQAGAPMEQAATNRQVVRAAVAAGLGGHDLSELATYLRAAGPDGG